MNDLKVNDYVYAYHGLLMYKAKVWRLRVHRVCAARNPQVCAFFKQILSIDPVSAINPNPRFLVHYDGWNRKYDEWVDHERVVLVTEESDRQCAELRSQHSGAGSKGAKRASKSSASGEGAGEGGKSHGRRSKAYSGAGSGSDDDGDGAQKERKQRRIVHDPDTVRCRHCVLPMSLLLTSRYVCMGMIPLVVD